MGRNDPIKVLGVGTITKDPEVGMAGEARYAKVTVANNRSFGQSKYVNFITLKVWGKQVEFVEKFLKKGKHIHFEGAWRTDSWEKDGQKKSFTYVDQANISFLPGGIAKKEGDDGGIEGMGTPVNEAPPEAGGFNDDDIPF